MTTLEKLQEIMVEIRQKTFPLDKSEYRMIQNITVYTDTRQKLALAKLKQTGALICKQLLKGM
jgi:hypothetical protein